MTLQYEMSADRIAASNDEQQQQQQQQHNGVQKCREHTTELWVAHQNQTRRGEGPVPD
jgi:hypothetical protein